MIVSHAVLYLALVMRGADTILVGELSQLGIDIIYPTVWTVFLLCPTSPPV